MKISVDAGALSDAVGLASSFVGGARADSPIMSSILIDAADNQAVFTAGDMANFIQVRVECAVQNPGKICLPAETLKNYASKAAEGVVIEVAEGRAKLKSGRSTATIPGFNGDDYPQWRESSADFVEIHSDVMTRMIKSVIASAAKIGSPRPSLIGINMSPVGNDLWFMAGDGYRLSVNRVPGQNFPERLTIPLEAVKKLNQVLKEDSVAQVRMHHTSAVVRVGNATMRFQLLDSPFPAMESAVPSEFAGSALVNRLDVIREIEIALGLGQRGMDRVVIARLESSLEIRAERSERGEYAGEIDATITGKFEKFKINGEYLADALKNTPGEMVYIAQPATGAICVVSPDDENIIHIVMPLR